MATLTRDQILEAQDRQSEAVAVPEWGGSVNVQSMTGAQRDAWERSLIERDADGKMVNTRAKLAAAVIVDDAGNALFAPDDVARLTLKSAAALDRICRVAQRLNRLTDEELEDARGNSSGAQSADSTSGRPTSTESQ